MEFDDTEYRATDGSTPGLASQITPGLASLITPGLANEIQESSVSQAKLKLQQERSPFALRSRKFESFRITKEQPLSGLYLRTQEKREKSLFSTPSLYQLDKLNVDIPEFGTSNSDSSVGEPSSDNVSLGVATKKQNLGAWSEEKHFLPMTNNDVFCDSPASPKSPVVPLKLAANPRFYSEKLYEEPVMTCK